MALGLPWSLRVGGTIVAVVAALLLTHLLSSGPDGSLRPAVLQRVAITPATTVSRFVNHFVAALFHRGWFHLGFNVAVFAVALPFASRHHGPVPAVAAAYLMGPMLVFLLHMLLVRPLAAAGAAYALRALDVPLVGFSVVAYAVVGMGVASHGSTTVKVAAIAAISAFELVVGAWLALTGPFIFAYHLAGLGAGFTLFRLLQHGTGGPS